MSAGFRCARSNPGHRSHLITVEDDGNGLDLDAIRGKAISKGLLRPEAEPTEQELLRFIFLPGFSTNETITAVSGRDVVNRQMETIGGSVAVETERGKYARFILKLPLTLAIIDGLLVRVGDEHVVAIVSGQSRYGLVVDRILGGIQAVIIDAEAIAS